MSTGIPASKKYSWNWILIQINILNRSTVKGDAEILNNVNSKL